MQWLVGRPPNLLITITMIITRERAIILFNDIKERVRKTHGVEIENPILYISK